MVFFEFGGGVQDYCFSLQYEVPYLKTKDLRNTDSASATVSFADNPWRSYLYQRSPDPKPKTTKKKCLDLDHPRLKTPRNLNPNP